MTYDPDIFLAACDTGYITVAEYVKYTKARTAAQFIPSKPISIKEFEERLKRQTNDRGNPLQGLLYGS